MHKPQSQDRCMIMYCEYHRTSTLEEYPGRHNNFLFGQSLMSNSLFLSGYGNICTYLYLFCLKLKHKYRLYYVSLRINSYLSMHKNYDAFQNDMWPCLVRLGVMLLGWWNTVRSIFHKKKCFFQNTTHIYILRFTCTCSFNSHIKVIRGLEL